MTHLPDPVYPEDVEANRDWFGAGDPPYHYELCPYNEGKDDCPSEKHYHPKAILSLIKRFKEGY